MAIRTTREEALQITPQLLARFASDAIKPLRVRGAILIVVDHDGDVVAGGVGLSAEQQLQAMALCERSLAMGTIRRVKL